MMTPFQYQNKDEQSFQEVQLSSDSLFSFGSLSPLPLYFLMHKKIPNDLSINSLDVEKAHNAFLEKYASFILNTYHTRRQLEGENEKLSFDDIYYCFGEDGLIVFDRHRESVRILYRNTSFALIEEIEALMMNQLKNYQDSELGLITSTNQGLAVSNFKINNTNLDLGLNYNDDLLSVHEIIQNRLMADKDKGLVLLYGEPGTGKTTYIRYLINHLQKRVLFVSPQIAEELHSPHLINLLLENKNSVLVIEDAEKILTSRENEKNSAVTTLLNLTDGLLSDCLNIQIICSFNTSLNRIDPALYRKGRLIAKYKFEKLSVEKSNRLANYLGYSIYFDESKALTDIFNLEEQRFQREERRVVGF